MTPTCTVHRPARLAVYRKTVAAADKRWPTLGKAHESRGHASSGAATSRAQGFLNERLAFTLVEVLLVLAIMGIMTLVAMPYLVKSIRGNRLRVATDTVVRAGRYARSMALLGQREMRLTFDVSQAAILVEPRYDTPRFGAAPASADGNAPAADSGREPSSASDESNAPPRFAPGLNVARSLDSVRIDYVEVGRRDRVSTGAVSVIYRSNGRCTPYEVRIVDEFGSATLTRVDALSTPNSERDDR